MQLEIWGKLLQLVLGNVDAFNTDTIKVDPWKHMNEKDRNG